MISNNNNNNNNNNCNKSKARARKNVLFYYSCVKDVVRVSQPLLILLFLFSYFGLKNCFGRRSTFFYGFNCVSFCLDSSFWGFVDGFLLSSSQFLQKGERCLSFRFVSHQPEDRKEHTIF